MVTIIMIISSMAIAADGFAGNASINNLNGIQNKPDSIADTSSINISDPYINLYWKGIISNDYIVNSSLNNTVFVAPYTNVSFNVSNAFYDISTSITYKDASYKWYSSGITIYNDTGYNASINFKNYKYIDEANISVNATANNNYDNTTFHVYLINSTLKPEIKTIVMQNSKVINETSGKYDVGQGQFTCVYGYNTSLKVYNTDYNVPLILNWAVNNYTYIGTDLNYTFEKPFKNETLYLNVTAVTGNFNNKTLTFYVMDTTPPVPVLTLTNSTGVIIKNPTVGVISNFSAYGSSDLYYPHNIAYKWSILYSNGTEMKQSINTYEIIKGNLTTQNMTLKVYTYKTMIVSLEVTNSLHISAYSNKTYTPIVTTPRLVVNSIYLPHLADGIKSTAYFNVSNDGTVTATSYKLYLIIDGKTYSESYTTPISPSAYKNLSFVFTPGVTGKYTVTAKAISSNEPSSFVSSGEYTESVTIGMYPYLIPIIIGVVVAAIIIIGVAYFEISKRREVHPRRKPANNETKINNTEPKKLEKKSTKNTKNKNNKN